MEHHPHMMMMHGQMPPQMMMHGMAPHPHGPMSMPEMMPTGMPDRKALHEAPTAPPPTKKKKKSSAKSQQQNTPIPPPHQLPMGMSHPGQMDPNLPLSRDPGPPIMAQSPFDDFPDQRHQHAHPHYRMAMPPPPGQQRMQFAAPPYPPMHPHGPHVNVQQLQHQMEMRSMGQGMPRMGHPDAAGNTVYPEDKCMVFNSQNPNAPPIYPCGRCHKEVHENDQAVLCESGCNFWFHRNCAGLTDPAYRLLSLEPFAEWACDGCCIRFQVPYVKLKP